MNQSLYERVVNDTIPNSASVAKLAAHIFYNKYVFRKIGKKMGWFERESDNKFKPIVDLVIRNRLTNELTNIIRNAREQLQIDRNYPNTEEVCSLSLISIQEKLNNLVEKRKTLRKLNKIDESLEIDKEINETETIINYMTVYQDRERYDIKDKKYAELLNAEKKLYNRTFKNHVMKDLEEILYEPHD